MQTKLFVGFIRLKSRKAIREQLWIDACGFRINYGCNCQGNGPQSVLIGPLTLWAKLRSPSSVVMWPSVGLGRNVS